MALSAAPAHHAGLAGGAFNTSRQIGGAIGVATLGAALNAGGAHPGCFTALTLAAAASALALHTTTKATPDHYEANAGSPPSRRRQGRS